MRASLVFRSVVALLLFAGFYLLAFAMVLFLSWLAYIQFVLERGNLMIAFFGVTTAGVIAWSLLPRGSASALRGRCSHQRSTPSFSP